MSDTILDRSKIEIKLGEYGTASYTNLFDQGMIATAREFKRSLSGKMYPLDREGMSKKIVNSDYHVSRKVDGEFTLLFVRDSEIFSLNPGGTVRVGLPWMEEAKTLLAGKLKSGTFAGELYVRKPDGKRSRVHDVVSVARNPKNQEELQSLGFAAFDVVELEGEAPPDEFEKRWEFIEQNLAGEKIHPVEAKHVTSSKEVKQIFEEWVEKESAEGLVVRSESAGFFKIKPRHTIDAVVMGFTESTGDREGMLHDLLIGLVRSDGSLQALTKVGGGFTDDQRREYLSDLKDQVVESEYAEVNSDHVAYQMVKPNRVVEISCLDLVSETTRGGPVNRMVLEYNEGYKVIRRFPLASVISPQFIQFRDDKQPNDKDAGIQQISKIVNVANFDVSAKELVFPKSEILSRMVYTKAAKGETMVRKFLVIKTNKDSQSEDYPAYVFHYTDFSPNRKTPLSKEVRVSSSLAQITAIRDQFEKDNIKKGWDPAGKDADREARKVVAEKQEDAPSSEGDGDSEPSKKKAVKKKATKKKVTKKAGDDSGAEETPVKKKKATKKKATKKKSTKKKAAKKSE